MQTFQEYYNGDNMMNANAVSVKQGGKSIMRAGRKHENLKRREYQHKCPHVRNCMHNGAPITLIWTAISKCSTDVWYGVSTRCY